MTILVGLSEQSRQDAGGTIFVELCRARHGGQTESRGATFKPTKKGPDHSIRAFFFQLGLNAEHRSSSVQRH